MILSGVEIAQHIGKDIIIEPFNLDQINPNSYNLTLDNKILIYDASELDMKQENPTKTMIIPDDGLVLYPNELYLAQTKEYTETHNFVPVIIGRSSIGRLGLSIHVTAGFGDIGFCGRWTLELTVVKPLRIYHGVKICQIYYQSISDEFNKYNSDKYQASFNIQPSKIYTEL